jgi:hypothetical protein
MASPDADIDRLYQLPLDQFTAERNALAKRAGPDGADIKQLAKPPLAAWAINQVHWRQPREYAALIDASEKLRAAHKAVLSGRKADLRATGKDHENALEAAQKAALAILAEDSHPVTDATRQAIASTLRALPSGDPPGRLGRTLQPGGFEMLAGVTPSARGAPASRQTTAAAKTSAAKASKEAAAKDGRAAKAVKASPAAIARARAEVSAAGRAVRDAEHAARREEFESARAAREAEKALKSLGAARAALERAQQELEEAETEAAAVIKASETASARAEKADEALAKARERERAAQAALDAL